MLKHMYANSEIDFFPFTSVCMYVCVIIHLLVLKNIPFLTRKSCVVCVCVHVVLSMVVVMVVSRTLPTDFQKKKRGDEQEKVTRTQH